MTYNGNSKTDNQMRVDKEAREGKCFYCHLSTEGSIGALHLRNARNVVQHIHDECDQALREELAFERYQESQLEGFYTSTTNAQPQSIPGAKND